MAFRALMPFLVGFTLIFCEQVYATQEYQLTGVISAPLPRFPPDLVGIKSSDGEVLLAFTIDAEGKVSDSLALRATNDSFANAATRAVNLWEFSPQKDVLARSESWPRREVTQFVFRRSGSVTTMSHAEAARDSFISTTTPQVITVQWDELDAEPEWLTTGMPRISKAVIEQHGDSPVAVHFIVDRQGQVRVPVISGTENLDLAHAVLESVRQWQYSSPMFRNQAVSAEVTRVLILDNPLENEQ